MRKTTGLWPSLEELAHPATVLVEWKGLLGREFDDARGFLQPTQETAQSFPCTNPEPCECQHEVVIHSSTKIVAACRCGLGECGLIALEPKDLLIYQADIRKIAKSVCLVLGLTMRFDSLIRPAKTFQISEFGVTHAPVFLALQSGSQAFLNTVFTLIGDIKRSFLLLAPTNSSFTPEAQAILVQHQCAFVALSQTLLLREEGRFEITVDPQPILSRFEQCLVEVQGGKVVLEEVNKNLRAIAKQDYDRVRENEGLKAMQVERFSKLFAQIDGESFRYFFAILNEGNMAKAARVLKISDRTFRDRVERWGQRGKQYQLMLTLVRCRKKIGTKVKVPYDDAILYKTVNSNAQFDILRDILDALEEQNPRNWKKVNEELKNVITDELPQ